MNQRATFTVPLSISEEKVKVALPGYIRKWMETREKQGWKVLSRVFLDPVPVVEGDRKRYYLYANLDREPKPQKIEVSSEKLIKRLEKKYGAKLLD